MQTILVNREPLLVAAGMLIAFMCGCAGPKPADGTPATMPVAVAATPTPPSIDEVRQMLKGELTVAQVKRRMGDLTGEHGGEMTWGTFSYELPGRRHLYFFFEGPYVTAACYDKTDIKGFSPPVHQLFVQCEMVGDRLCWHLQMDGRRFANQGELQKYVESLPKGALVKYQMSCDTFGDPPLRTHEQLEGLRALCKKAGVILLYYPAG